MDPIKEAFLKAKQDILTLQGQINSLKEEIINLKRTLSILTLGKAIGHPIQSPSNPTDPFILSSKIQENQTFQHVPNDKIAQYGLKGHFINSSTGNDGVPTDRQTNRQTDQHIGNRGVETLRMEPKEDKISHLERVSEVLNSLDTIKKEIRTKFKHLTIQEMTVFSTIYELEDKGFIVDYSLISSKLDLSESSIRDYVQKIIKKGIPITKTKENNKKILVSIDPNLKKIASLETINLLRGL